MCSTSASLVTEGYHGHYPTLSAATVTEIWAASWPDEDQQTVVAYYDTEAEAERVAKAKQRELELIEEQRRHAGWLRLTSPTLAVCYPVVVEPPVRPGYWDRPREAAA